MAKDPALLFSKLDCDGFPPIKGKSVYAVFVRNWHTGADHLMYIGSSIDVEKRRNHSSHPYRICYERFPDRVVSVKTFLTEDYRDDERILIKHFKPLLNKTYNG
jgi:hypothetical protein